MSTLKPTCASSTVYMCHGSDCRKKKKEWTALTESLSEQGTVCAVRCQKICKGPVVGIEVNGRLEWFTKLKKKTLHRQFLALTQSGTVPERLKTRLSKKRQGKLRGSAGKKAPSRAA